MKYVVAVSGGVDSVVLLDMLSRVPEHELVVAHFDHGIRSDSARDALFVQSLARRYGHAFETRREELGEQASEELARTRRYAFLRELAAQHNGRIVTAHHADDAVETIAINHTRGTGWRGVAVLDSHDIARPLVGMHKSEIIDYARKQQLPWREDSTNASEKYLRNRIRRKVAALSSEEKQQLLALRTRQLELKKTIEQEVRVLIGDGPQYQRYFFSHIPTSAALECLRFATDGRLTRPQLERVLIAIKTARPGAHIEPGGGIRIRFSTRNFLVELIK